MINVNRAWSKRPRVLLVDDEPAITAAIVDALRKQPYDFIAVHSAAAAWQVLEEQSIDVIIADECMPEMNGTELLAQVKQRFPAVIRIMLTGHGGVETAMKAIHDGWVYQYLQKPCSPADLASTLYNALVLRSFMLPDEGPHLRMSSSEEEKLIEGLGRPKA